MSRRAAWLTPAILVAIAAILGATAVRPCEASLSTGSGTCVLGTAAGDEISDDECGDEMPVAEGGTPVGFGPSAVPFFHACPPLPLAAGALTAPDRPPSLN